MTTGATRLIEAAMAIGLEVCFANPGTTEMPVVAALDGAHGMRVVLGLFEGVCAGAADGWARMTRRPAVTLLHLGPGLANGLAHLHNARRARTPVVNWVGDHATEHVAYDAPLASDIGAVAGSVGWVRTVRSAAEMGEASRAAVRAALGPPGRVATLILPNDHLWNVAPEATDPTASGRATGSDVAGAGPAVPDPREAARLLRRGRGGLLLGGTALTKRGLRAAGRVAAATGCEVWLETFPARVERGRHVPAFRALPYFPEQARDALAGVAALVLAGARAPVAFFAYPGQPSELAPETTVVHALADPDAGVDATAALEALVEELGAVAVEVAEPARPAATLAPDGRELEPEVVCRTLAALVPEGAIVVNEATTTGLAWNVTHAATAAPHTMLGQSGGAIGTGLPLALGAAVACADRRVVAFQADGSGLYAPQALWSMAREGADVTVVVCANRRYRILQTELARAGVTDPGPKARSLTELDRPAMDWSALAKGFGVPSCRVETDTALAGAIARSLADRGPSLIEAVMP